MPASLYRLAGKPHHTEVRTPVTDAAPEQHLQTVAVEEPISVHVSEPTVEQIVTSPAEQLVEQLTAISAEAELKVAIAVAPEPEAAPEPTRIVPNWDPSWSKTKLLEVATRLGLNVSPISTKSEIVDALTAATSV